MGVPRSRGSVRVRPVPGVPGVPRVPRGPEVPTVPQGPAGPLGYRRSLGACIDSKGPDLFLGSKGGQPPGQGGLSHYDSHLRAKHRQLMDKYRPEQPTKHRSWSAMDYAASQNLVKDVLVMLVRQHGLPWSVTQSPWMERLLTTVGRMPWKSPSRSELQRRAADLTRRTMDLVAAELRRAQAVSLVADEWRPPPGSHRGPPFLPSMDP